jgi:hypothetical protein
LTGRLVSSRNWPRRRCWWFGLFRRRNDRLTATRRKDRI